MKKRTTTKSLKG
jgi:hypothetical protein